MKLTLLSALLPALFAPGLFTSHMTERSAASGGSKIEKELMDAADLGAKRGEDRQDLLARIVKAVASLSDKDWDGLSQAAQDWFNKAADAKNAKADKLPDFPDLAGEEEPTTTRRRGAKEEISLEPKVGDKVEVETKRGKKVVGKIVEIDKEVVVIKGDDGEEEFSRDRLAMITVLNGTAKGSSEAEEPADPLAKGATVSIKTKRGKEVTGKIVEIDDEVLVLEVDGKEEEFARDRVETITPAGGGSTSRRASSTTKPDAPAADAGHTRSKNEGGVSVGTRIKELISENLDASEEEIGKLLKKEKIEFKDNTLKLNYVDARKFIDILKSKKMLKA